jgi:hypothetical protein
MEAVQNISSSPKLLAYPPDPVLTVVTIGTPPEHLPHCTVETIRQRAETVTPLLKDILEHTPPERWGINE